MKKWLLIGMVLVIALTGVLIGCTCGKSRAPGAETPGEGKPVTAGTVQIPDGPKIKVVFNGPPELKVSWEELGTTGIYGWGIQLDGTLKNISSQTVKFSEIAFLLDNKQVAYSYSQTLKPGEETRILKVIDIYSETTKVLEVKIEGFQIIGGTVTTTPEPSGNVFTKALENPKTPGEVVAAFYFSINEERYLAAAKLIEGVEPLIESGKINEAEATAELEGTLKSGELKTIKVESVKIDDDRASISITLHFKDGEEKYISLSLIKENGEWKMALVNF